MIKAVERGVLLKGALPIPFPTISLHESFANPTSMNLRNLMALDTEEMVRAQPMDGVVLVSGNLRVSGCVRANCCDYVDRRVR